MDIYLLNRLLFFFFIFFFFGTKHPGKLLLLFLKNKN